MSIEQLFEELQIAFVANYSPNDDFENNVDVSVYKHELFMLQVELSEDNYNFVLTPLCDDL